MSVARKVKMKTDLDLMRQAAENCGFATVQNGVVRGYYGAMEGTSELVVQGKDRYDVGFNTDSITADFHMGHADEILEKVMPNYHRMKAEQNYMTVEQTVKGSDGKIRLYIRR